MPLMLKILNCVTGTAVKTSALKVFIFLQKRKKVSNKDKDTLYHPLNIHYVAGTLSMLSNLILTT